MRANFYNESTNSTLVVEIGFQHDKEFTSYEGIKDLARRTQCFVTLSFFNGTLMHQSMIIGEAYCSIKDTFVKETGRRKSLGRVLSQFPYKDFKEAVEYCYQDRKNNGFLYLEDKLCVCMLDENSSYDEPMTSTPSIVVDGIEISAKEFYSLFHTLTA
jgi:hypothetical protein